MADTPVKSSRRHGQDRSAAPEAQQDVTGPRVTTLQWLLLVLIVLLLAVGVWLGLPPRQTPAPLAPEAAGPTPAPWHHDVESNRHWHPGHAHWHDGPPPPEELR